jgi:hypothetical protein
MQAAAAAAAVVHLPHKHAQTWHVQSASEGTASICSYSVQQQQLTCASRTRHAGDALCLAPRAVAVVAAERAVGTTIASSTHCKDEQHSRHSRAISYTDPSVHYH